MTYSKWIQVYIADNFLLSRLIAREMVLKDKNLINSFTKSNKCKFSPRSKKKPNSNSSYEWNTKNFANQSNQESLATYQESQWPYDDWKVWKKKFWINWHSNLKSHRNLFPLITHANTDLFKRSQTSSQSFCRRFIEQFHFWKGKIHIRVISLQVIDQKFHRV